MSMRVMFTKNNIMMSLQGCVGIENPTVSVLKQEGDQLQVKIGFTYKNQIVSSIGTFIAGESIDNTVKTVGQVVLSAISAVSDGHLIRCLDGYDRLHKNKQVLEVI